MWNSAARKQATTGPAPPKATSVKSRGSSPCRAMAWLNSAYMLASATSMIASAAASTDRPSRSAIGPDRLAGARGIEPDPPAHEVVGVDQAADHEGVGQRRLGPAPPVAGRAGVGAGAPGADLEEPGPVEPGDGAAAGADRGDADGRHDHREVADVLVVGVRGLAAPHDRDVGARPADVEREQLLIARQLRRVDGADHPGRRPREQRLHRNVPRAPRRHDAAVRLGDVGLDAEADLAQPVGQAVEVGRQLGPDVRVEDRHDRPLVLADLGPDLVGAADVEVRGHPRGDGAHGPLVLRVPVAVDEADDDPVDALGHRRAHGGLHARGVQRDVNRPVGQQPLCDLEDPPPRDEGRRTVRDEVHGVRQAEALDLQDVADAPGDDEREVGPRSLDHGVEPDRRPVDEVLDLREVEALAPHEVPEARGHPLGEVVGHRRRLVADEAAGRLVEQAEVGERAADIDPQPIRHRVPLATLYTRYSRRT